MQTKDAESLRSHEKMEKPKRIPFAKMYSNGVRLRVLAGMPPAWLYLHKRRRYVEQKILATPPWVSYRDFLALHSEKQRLLEETGVKHSLDHIVPLNHPMVCGLNVPWNIQVIPSNVNATKSNRWSPEQMEIGFDLMLAGPSVKALIEGNWLIDPPGVDRGV